MQVTVHPRRCYFVPIALGWALFWVRSSAQADLKVVSQVEVTGYPVQAPDSSIPEGPQTVTAYYQGDKARVEGEKGPVTLFDFKAGKITTLDPGNKTYWVVSLKKGPRVPSQGDGGPRGGGMKMKTETKITLKAEEEKKTLVEKEARKYVFTGTVKMVPDFEGEGPRGRGPGGGGFPGGGGPGGGGFPGGGGPGGGPPPGRGGPREEGPQGPGRSLAALEVEGEYWLAEGVTALVPVFKNKNALLPAFGPTLPDNPLTGMLLSSLVTKMAKTKGFPLASRVTVKPSRSQRPEEEVETNAPEPIVITMTVQSIATESLADSLFQVPEGYRQTEPTPPRRGPGAGGADQPPPVPPQG